MDFKVSHGFAGRVLVEIKLSKNSKLINGYTKHLEAYKVAEETLLGFYVVVDVGKMGDKDTRLFGIKNDAADRGEKVSPIIFVDGSRRTAASKL